VARYSGRVIDALLRQQELLSRSSSNGMVVMLVRAGRVQAAFGGSCSVQVGWYQSEGFLLDCWCYCVVTMKAFRIVML
jgi:hypothetical protein